MLYVGLVGAGIFAREAHRPALLPLIRADRVRLSAIWSQSSKSADELAKLYSPDASPEVLCGDDGLQSLFDNANINAVILAVPIPRLAPIARAALHAGKHVLAEKPLAGSVKEALQALQNYEIMGHNAPMYCVAENFRFEDSFTRLASIVQGGVLGALIGLELSVQYHLPENAKYARGWRIDAENLGYVGGMLLDSGVHAIAGMRVALGADVKSVTAITRKLTKHLPAVDSVHALLEFENDVPATVTITYAAMTPSWEMRVLGTRGRANLVRSTDAGKFGYRLSVTGAECADSNDFIPFMGVDKEMAAFIRACETGERDKNMSSTAAFNDVAVIEAMIESYKVGQKVTVTKVGSS